LLSPLRKAARSGLVKIVSIYQARQTFAHARLRQTAQDYHIRVLVFAHWAHLEII
jgi:hypothetical protein